MTEAGRAIVAAVRDDPARALLSFDFDGTLAEVQRRPEDAHFFAPAAEAIARLGARVGQIAVITGRAAATVVELGELAGRPGFERAVVYGQYGVERWDAASGRFDSPPAPESVALAMADLASALEEQHGSGISIDGIYLEDKGRAIGVHYRLHASPGDAGAWLRPLVAAVADRHGLVVEPGRAVIEVRSSEVTKGDALTALIEEYRPRVVLVFGDDLGDVPAFVAAATAREQGLTTANIVAASSEAEAVLPHADIVCDGPVGVAEFLADLGDALEKA